MAKRTRRADDQERLVEERARGSAPRARRAASDPAPEPKPKRPRGRPRKNVPPITEPDGPPTTEPDAVELEPGPVDDAGRPLSALWDVMRSGYRPAVRAQVEALMRQGALEIDDLVWLELAEHSDLGCMLRGPTPPTERFADRLISSRLQARKQIMRLIVERGPVGGVNARQVRVPVGLELEALTRPPDTGEDVLAEPDIDKLPERYREAARATFRPGPGTPG